MEENNNSDNDNDGPIDLARAVHPAGPGDPASDLFLYTEAYSAPGTEIEAKVYTARQLLEKTERSIMARARKGKNKDPAAPKKPPNPTRVWRPQGEYELFRSGPTLPMMPEDCVSSLQESTMWLFKNIDESVRFGEDELRPLWVGVFKISEKLGYEEDEYYKPTQDQLKQIYQAEFPRKTKPSDNMRVLRDGRKTPYWIDAWEHFKRKQAKDKLNSQKKQAAAKAMQALEENAEPKKAPAEKKRPRPTQDPGDDVPFIAPVDEKVVFALEGWLKKGNTPTSTTASTLLKKGPAHELAGKIVMYAGELARANGHSGAMIEEKDEDASAPLLVKKQKPDAQEQKQEKPETPAPKPQTPHQPQQQQPNLRRAAIEYVDAMRGLWDAGKQDSVEAGLVPFFNGSISEDPATLFEDFAMYVVQNSKWRKIHDL